MVRTSTSLLLVAALLLCTGCVSGGKWFEGFDSQGWDVKKTYAKTKFGPECRENADGDSSTRWTAQMGLWTEMDNSHKVGVTYRRRDVDGGGGGHDNAFWLEWEIPIWKAPERSATAQIRMEERLALLEADRDGNNANARLKASP
jgi:hypothetical protein